MQRRILIAEDNIEISDTMRNYLIRAGYTVYQAFDGGDALEQARKLSPDLILLDIMMPVADGYEVCESIRRDMNVPIIVVSAKVAEEDTVRLFELGADDYITKPFSFKEMVCRVNAQIRRYYDLNRTAANADRYLGDLMISPDRFEAKVKGEPLNLTAKEFKILDYLTLNRNQIFSKQKLIDAVWGIDEYIDENTVDVYVGYLRGKIDQPAGEEYIKTVRGSGYMMVNS